MSRIRIAVLGCGGIARHHVSQFKAHEDAEIVALCDVSEKQVKAFAESQFAQDDKQPPVYTDPACMYAECKPDAVTICTPHTLHFDHCMQALESGCHVLVEKPMVTSLAQAHALKSKVKENGHIFVIGYNTPCSAEISYVRDAIRKQTFGKLKVVSCYISQPWYHFVQNTWRMKPELSGGGMIYDSGAHVLNSLVWTVESDVAEVHAWIDNLGSPVDINGTVNVRFTNGVLATIAVSGETPQGAFGAWMFEHGLIEANPWYSEFLRVSDRKGKIKYPQVADPGSSPMHNFIEAILGRAEPRTTPHNGVVQSQLMDAIYASASSGQAVKVADLAP